MHCLELKKLDHLLLKCIWRDIVPLGPALLVLRGNLGGFLLLRLLLDLPNGIRVDFVPLRDERRLKLLLGDLAKVDVLAEPGVGLELIKEHVVGPEAPGWVAIQAAANEVDCECALRGLEDARDVLDFHRTGRVAIGQAVSTGRRLRKELLVIALRGRGPEGALPDEHLKDHAAKRPPVYRLVVGGLLAVRVILTELVPPEHFWRHVS
mmetsp:Transcript_22512/g.64023  ORF Transcript_22512/g.64023 Transcript_22512/m.64023 type:complete len:208 (+) Transcript_22512:101-724(+)